ncbi:MAG TPA: aldehyde dehydrogenase family protein [Microvirga sp.]|nr:aldehyde dehydrogenase family protein [Microvirga sp.]
MNAPALIRTRLDEALARIPKAFGLLVDGRLRREAADGRTIERASPAHDVVVSRYPRAGPDEVEAAIAAARTAFDHGPWPRMTGAERSRILHRAADLIDGKAEILALLDALEGGKPIAQVRGEIAGSVDIWRYAAGLARDLHGESYAHLGERKLGVVMRDPIGVVSIITPWNFPFLIVSQKLPFALAAGCTIVVKPSELTSASTLLLGEILLEAGMPAGAVNILAGTGPEVGAVMTAHRSVDMVSFTGSTAVGKRTMASASDTLKKVVMELGGKNPQIVFDDADMDAAADAAVFGAFFNAGECCNAGSRLILQRSIAGDFVAAVVERSKDVPVGDPLDPGTKVGAIITPQHLSKIKSSIEEAKAAGADLRLGGGRLPFPAGLFMEPTVLSGIEPNMRIAREEVFGPVLSALVFDTEDEAAAIANATEYGLSAGIWSRSFDRCLTVGRRLRAGTVWMNTFMDGAPELPFGGYGQSGLGRELGRGAVEDFTETKTLHMHHGPRTAWWTGSKNAVD